jgi:hypothetical protein
MIIQIISKTLLQYLHIALRLVAIVGYISASVWSTFHNTFGCYYLHGRKQAQQESYIKLY